MRIPIFISATVVLLSLVIPLIHYFTFDKEIYMRDIQSYTQMTSLSSIAYSVSWFEPRVRRFESSINRETPQLPSQDRLIFVYGDTDVE